MSLEAMVWALTRAPVEDPVARLVLVGLGNHAGPDGRGARPAQATLARYVSVSSRTVRTKLRLLEELGLIREGDQQMVAHLRAGYRPTVYDLDLSRVRAEDFSAHDETGKRRPGDRKTATARQEKYDRETGSCFPTEPSMNLSKEPSMNTPPILEGELLEPGALPLTADAESVDWFEAFYAAYPRRVGKGKARLAFEKAALRESPSVIVDAARRLADDPNLPDPQFVPHPTTWLNRDGWGDDPYPSRGGGSWIADELDRAARFSAGGGDR